MEEQPTLVIGDVHGHLDRLEALLMQEGVIGPCSDCDGVGGEFDLCPACNGDGIRRINEDVNVIQLGDLGHFGADASPTGDLLCYRYVTHANWVDLVLWGNHDRACIDAVHGFKNYLKPLPEIYHFMHLLYSEGRLALATAVHGHLITHAGLHSQWKHQPHIPFDKDDPYAFAGWMNANDWWPREIEIDGGDKTAFQAMAIRDAVGRRRNGVSPFGGILWRDRNEKIYDGFPQVFGHTPDKNGLVRRFSENGVDLHGKHIGLDVGGKYEPRLAGVWLPDERIVKVEL